MMRRAVSRMHNTLDVRASHDRLNDEELDELTRKLAAIGARAEIPAGDGGDVQELFGDVDEGALDEFLDRLDAVGVRADRYLPVPFDGAVSLSALTCGSAHALQGALTKIRSDLELDLDLDPGGRDRRLAKQRNLWKRFRAGAKLAVRRGLVLEIVRF